MFDNSGKTVSYARSFCAFAFIHQYNGFEVKQLIGKYNKKYKVPRLGITTVYIHSPPHFQGLKCNWTNKCNHKYNVHL